MTDFSYQANTIHKRQKLVQFERKNNKQHKEMALFSPFIRRLILHDVTSTVFFDDIMKRVSIWSFGSRGRKDEMQYREIQPIKTVPTL